MCAGLEAAREERLGGRRSRRSCQRMRSCGDLAVVYSSGEARTHFYVRRLGDEHIPTKNGARDRFPPLRELGGIARDDSSSLLSPGVETVCWA